MDYYNKNQGSGRQPQKSTRDSNSQSNTNNGDSRSSVESFWNTFNFNPDWIIKGADESMIEFAKEAGKYMAPQDSRDKERLSKSQIRNVFGEIKRIQLKGYDTPEGKSAFMLLKPKVAYAEGRNKTKGLSLFKKIFDAGWKSVEGRMSYNNFCALLESVLAYHKAYGGKD